ncbi:MAG: hypothetical protein AB7V16_12535 [Vulcanibacillus sp.]
MSINIIHDNILNFAIENKIFFTTLITISIVRFKHLSKTNNYFAALVYFIGTFFHELSHYIVALITTMKIPKKVSLFPKVENINGKKSIVLGYVEISKENVNIFNAFPIAMAPLILLYLAYLVSKYFFIFYTNYYQINLFGYFVYLFLITTLIVNSVPSSADFKMAKTNGSIYLYFVLFVSLSIYIIF